MRSHSLVAVVTAATALLATRAGAAPIVTPNEPYVAGVNAVVLEGGGAPAVAAAAVAADSDMRVDALWMLVAGEWRFYLPAHPAIDGRLGTLPASPVAAFVVLSPVVVTSGVEGAVTIGPQCPVQRKDDPCPDLPYAARLTILDSDGRVVAEVMSGADGRYRVALPPGEYTIVPATPEASPFPFATPVEVIVVADDFTTVDIAYDTGIR